MHTAIIIPARYQSTRLPGKPLIDIAGKTMLQRVVEIAQLAASDIADTSVTVATDDERILTHAQALGVDAVMTPQDCRTGTDRVLAAVKQSKKTADFVINLQGDVPITPPNFVTQLIQALHQAKEDCIATPIVKLTWAALDELRNFKQQTPFSGTTAVIDANHNALWFSKQIIPAIRKEAELRQQSDFSPVYRHIGLYGYTFAALERYAKLPEGRYEALEGLEQLRALENAIPIKTVEVSYNGRPEMTGVDTPEDATRVAKLIEAHGESA